MTRRLFGGGTSDYVAHIVGGALLSAGVVNITFWTTKTAGTQITDLLDETGVATTSINSHSSGQVPQFSGPNDGTSIMWGDAGGPERSAFLASDGSTSGAGLDATAVQALIDAATTGG